MYLLFRHGKISKYLQLCLGKTASASDQASLQWQPKRSTSTNSWIRAMNSWNQSHGQDMLCPAVQTLLASMCLLERDGQSQKTGKHMSKPRHQAFTSKLPVRFVQTSVCGTSYLLPADTMSRTERMSSFPYHRHSYPSTMKNLTAHRNKLARTAWTDVRTPQRQVSRAM